MHKVSIDVGFPIKRALDKILSLSFYYLKIRKYRYYLVFTTNYLVQCWLTIILSTSSFSVVARIFL